MSMVGHNSAGRVRCIFRAHGERGYTKLRNAFLQDRRISDETRGLVARLLSLPEDWEVTVQSIIASGKAGRDKVYRMIKEAEEFGYVQPDGQSRTTGKFDRQVYFVSDDPETLINRTAQELYEIEVSGEPRPVLPEAVEAPCPENTDAAEMQHKELAGVAREQRKEVAGNSRFSHVSPCPENTDAAPESHAENTDATFVPHPAKPYPANRTHKRNIEDNINNPPIVPPGGTPEQKSGSRAKRGRCQVPDQYSHDFEEFWKVYPRREGKGAAFRSWQRLNLDQKRRAYVALKKQLPSLTAKLNDPRDNYCPFPATWLNQGRFDDEPTNPDRTGSVPPKDGEWQGKYFINGRECRSREEYEEVQRARRRSG